MAKTEPTLDSLTVEELEALVQRLVDETAALRAHTRAVRAEINQRKYRDQVTTMSDGERSALLQALVAESADSTSEVGELQ